MNRKIFLAVVVTAIVAYTALWEGCFGACSYITDSVYYMRFADRMLGNGVDDGGGCYVAYRILFFLGMGIMYYLTMASLSSVGNFNELGFRLLYPGTIMAVIGISIAVAERINVDGWLASLSSLRFSAYLLVVFVVGCNLLSAELGIRRLLGVSVYSIGEPYQQKILKLTEKYGAERSGSTVVLKGLGDPDFFIGCLRPDLYIEFPKGCKRY